MSNAPANTDRGTRSTTLRRAVTVTSDTLRRTASNAIPRVQNATSNFASATARFFGLEENPDQDYSYFSRNIDDAIPTRERATTVGDMVSRVFSGRNKNSQRQQNLEPQRGQSSAAVRDVEDFEFYSDDEESRRASMVLDERVRIQEERLNREQNIAHGRPSSQFLETFIPEEVFAPSVYAPPPVFVDVDVGSPSYEIPRASNISSTPVLTEPSQRSDMRASRPPSHVPPNLAEPVGLDGLPSYNDVQEEMIMNELPGVTPEMIRDMPALRDPKVRAQLAKLKPHRPWFLMLMTLAQAAILIYEFVLYNQTTGNIIETNPFNPMIGPDTTTLIHLGAKFTPCEFATSPPYVNNSLCPEEYQTAYPLIAFPYGNTTINCGNLEEFCGLTTFTDPDVGNQWYRVFTAIFLHGGVVHYLINMFFQVRTGFQMEQDMGFIRMFFIYMLSGVGGFLMASNFAPLNPSVGASAALFGLVAALLLDLINNWNLVKNPKRALVVMLVMIVVCFAVGLLPWLDNWAHIGGFICGIFASMIFMPTITFGKWDGRRKLIMILVSIPCLALIYFGLIYSLVNAVNVSAACPGCKYLDCFPFVAGWCDDK